MKSDMKEHVRQFWNQTPCGTREIKYVEGTSEFFAQLEEERDSREPFISSFANFSKWKNKKVLEVGVGAATDFIRFARGGAVLSGIDLTQHAVDLANRRLELEGLTADLRQGNAEGLPFEDGLFDFTYSWGVIHHTGDV